MNLVKSEAKAFAIVAGVFLGGSYLMHRYSKW